MNLRNLTKRANLILVVFLSLFVYQSIGGFDGADIAFIDLIPPVTLVVFLVAFSLSTFYILTAPKHESDEATKSRMRTLKFYGIVSLVVFGLLMLSLYISSVIMGAWG